MSQLLIRNLSRETINCLKNMAKAHHRSLQGEIQFILEQVTKSSEVPRKWPEGFCEQVLGGWQGEHLKRSPQGKYEKRDDLE